MSDRLRCFVALNLPDALKEAVGRFTDTLRSRVREVRWVKGENLHFTLKFLGDVESTKVAEVSGALERAVAGQAPFSVTLDGAGVFPPRGRPRVVWVDTGAGRREMEALQARVEEALAPLGFPPEGRPFTPHLTVGRARDLRDPRPLLEALSAAAGAPFGEFAAERVHLMRSELFPAGPRYSILQQFRLTPREADGKEKQ